MNANWVVGRLRGSEDTRTVPVHASPHPLTPRAAQWNFRYLILFTQPTITSTRQYYGDILTDLIQVNYICEHKNDVMKTAHDADFLTYTT